MKKTIILIFCLISFNLTLSAQTPPVSQYLYKFSPLAEIIARNLGLVDKNGNGVIDKAENEGGEGYEQFVAKYGNGGTFAEKEKSIDCGFHANYVMYGTGNAKLEENEIVNHYYLNIRFKHTEETEIIENEIKAYIYANNLPLVWLDDEQGTVMKAVTQILGEGWNEKEVTEDEAAAMLNKVLWSMQIKGRQGQPNQNGGYYTLPEFIIKKSGYCEEVAQFGFWFFSELRINSIVVYTFLTDSKLHAVIKITNSGKIIDFFNSSVEYRISAGSWDIINPLQCLGSYFGTQGLQKRNTNQENHTNLLEQAVIYDKYYIQTAAVLMQDYLRKERYQEVIILGDYIFKNINIENIMKNKRLGQWESKNNLKTILLYLIKSYGLTNNVEKFNGIEAILKQYYNKDVYVNEYISYYRP